MPMDLDPTMPINALATVVIPTYRRPAMLRRAIASAVEQEGPPLRVRVFDNCSGDGTADVVAEFARSHPGVEYHCHASNLGATANFEFALRSIDTPYFSILSDDDYLLPGFLRRAVDCLQADPEAVFWAGATLSVDESGTIWDARVTRWPRFGRFEPPEGVLALMSGMAPAWTSVMFQRAVVDLSGPPDLAMLGPSDLDFMLRLASRHPYVVENHPAAVFTLNTSSYSATQPLSAFWPGWRKMMANVEGWDFLPAADRDRMAARLREDFHRMLFRRGANALAAGRLDFVREAAGLLREQPGQRPRGDLLAALAWACATLPGAQRAASASYRWMERRLVENRRDLQDRFGGLLKPV